MCVELGGFAVDSLHLQGCGITNAWLKHLNNLKGVRILSLSDNPISDDGFVSLQDAQTAIPYHQWDSSHTGLGFAKLGTMPAFSSLDISRTRLNDQGLLKLVAACPNLEALNISQSPIQRGINI